MPRRAVLLMLLIPFAVRAEPAGPPVILAGKLDEQDLIAVSVAAAATEPASVFLLDSAKDNRR